MVEYCTILNTAGGSLRGTDWIAEHPGIPEKFVTFLTIKIFFILQIDKTSQLVYFRQLALVAIFSVFDIPGAFSFSFLHGYFVNDKREKIIGNVINFSGLLKSEMKSELAVIITEK